MRKSQRRRFHANGNGKRERPCAARRRVTTVGDVYNPFQTLRMLIYWSVEKAFYITVHDLQGFTLDLHFSNGYASTVRSFGAFRTLRSAWRHSERGKARSFLARFSHILFRQGVVNTVVWRLRELIGSCSGWPRRKVAGNGAVSCLTVLYKSKNPENLPQLWRAEKITGAH